MNLLLDTHVLLWTASQPSRLSARARTRLLDAANTLHFSVASLWEVGIKSALGRPDFQVDAQRLRTQLMAAGYRELVIEAKHVFAVKTLPPLHRDPFDRLLLAQARCEGHSLVTADARLLTYGDDILSA